MDWFFWNVVEYNQEPVGMYQCFSVSSIDISLNPLQFMKWPRWPQSCETLPLDTQISAEQQQNMLTDK